MKKTNLPTKSQTPPVPIEHICRKYNFIPAKMEHYDSNLSELQKRIETSYDSAFSSYEEEKKKITKIQEDLKEVSTDQTKGFFSGVWDIMNTDLFGRNGNGKAKGSRLEEIEKLGDALLEKREKIKGLQTIVNENYNRHAEVVYTISQGVSAFQDLTLQYERTLEETEAEIRDLHSLQSDKPALLLKVKEMVEKKAQKEGKKISEDEKEVLINFYTKKGRERLTELSKKYLEVSNDLILVREISAYSTLVDNYNQLSDSLDIVRKDLSESLTEVQKVLLTYETITKKEVALLQNGIPQEFMESLNTLSDNMEELNQEFSLKALDLQLKGGSKKVRLPEMDEVSNGLISHLKNYTPNDNPKPPCPPPKHKY